MGTLPWWVLGLGSISVFELLRAHADNLGSPVRGASLEATLFGGTLPSLWLQDHIYALWPAGLGLAATLIHGSWFFVWIIAAAYVTLTRPRRLPWFFLSWAILQAIAVACFALLPLQPPWMADSGVERIFANYISAEVDPNPVAAMPSLHAAFPILLGLWFLRERQRPAAIAAFAYSALIGAEVVFSGEHYVIDVVGAAAVSAITMVAVARAEGLYASVRSSVAARRYPRGALAADRAQGLVEFALLFPFILVFISAIIIFGLVLQARAGLQQGVREGARQAAVGKTLAEVQARAAGNAPDSLDPDEVQWCLPSGSNGNVGDSIRVYIVDGDDNQEGLLYTLVPTGGIFQALGVADVTVRLDPRATARLEKSMTTVPACP